VGWILNPIGNLVGGLSLKAFDALQKKFPEKKKLGKFLEGCKFFSYHTARFVSPTVLDVPVLLLADQVDPGFFLGTWESAETSSIPDGTEMSEPITVTYNADDVLKNLTSGMSEQEVQRTVQDGLKLWEEHSNITFMEVSNPQSAMILMKSGEIDGFGGIQGQAYYPLDGEWSPTDHINHANTFYGNIEIDRGDIWNSDKLRALVQHEVGHALGVAHVEGDPDAIMYPLLHRKVQVEPVLPESDIHELEEIYGHTKGRPAGKEFSVFGKTVDAEEVLLPWYIRNFKRIKFFASL
jgi:hypothetical protein